MDTGDASDVQVWIAHFRVIWVPMIGKNLVRCYVDALQINGSYTPAS